MCSPEFDQIAIMGATFGRLPSEILRPLVPELAGRVQPLDWYLFDATAAERYYALRREASEHEVADVARLAGEATGGARGDAAASGDRARLEARAQARAEARAAAESRAADSADGEVDTASDAATYAPDRTRRRAVVHDGATLMVGTETPPWAR